LNLRKTILAVHSKANAIKIAKWVGKDKKRFAELVKIFLHDEYRVTQRAAWPLSYCVEMHPELAYPHLGKLIDHLSAPGRHPAVPRNILRLLEFIDVPEKHLGKLTDVCFRLLQKSDSPVAVKAYAMTLLAEIVKKEPGLARELKLVVEDLMPEGTAAIRSRGKRVLKLLEMLA
jgi:hypothetical protein